MDIIAEILNTEKIAEDRLKAAEEEKLRIINETAQAEERLQSEAEKEINSYRASKQTETDAAIEKLVSGINAECGERISGLDRLYEKNHADWENGIFERIVT
ncbi:hypothetical protein [Ruminococcus sp. Marseille-P6503]|uniref:hypothetical protein n=1 Tax=Ruminococcus sp. Marseille-P6503 TaxID=2364796 RepID=UPI000F5401D0|nr:hypothetical protein [Ruminococcus sp. Marseille-P6503]